MFYESENDMIYISSFIINLVLMLTLMPIYIKLLKKLNYNQVVSEYSLDEYKDKQKTPIMGGLLFILFPIIVCILLVSDIMYDINLLICIFAYIMYGLIGFVDDYTVITKGKNEGLKASTRLILQFILALVFVYVYLSNNETSYLLVSSNMFYLVFYLIIAFIMFAGTTNAVNITDGMDGLAGGCALVSLGAFTIIAYSLGHSNLVVFLVGVIGSLVGYLRYNHFPAQIFMGDTGSNALGGLLAAIALVLHKEFLLVIIGGIFVWEVMCVIIQISSVKLRGKRVFKYTPIHYSFVISGYKEKVVVYGFWLLSTVLALVGIFINFL